MNFIRLLGLALALAISNSLICAKLVVDNSKNKLFKVQLILKGGYLISDVIIEAVPGELKNIESRWCYNRVEVNMLVPQTDGTFKNGAKFTRNLETSCVYTVTFNANQNQVQISVNKTSKTISYAEAQNPNFSVAF